MKENEELSRTIKRFSAWIRAKAILKDAETNYKEAIKMTADSMKFGDTYLLEVDGKYYSIKKVGNRGYISDVEIENFKDFIKVGNF